MGIKGDGPNDEATHHRGEGRHHRRRGRPPGPGGPGGPLHRAEDERQHRRGLPGRRAGFKLNLDPTIELQFPIEPSLHWSLRWLADAGRLAWELVPGIRIGFDVVGFGGNLVFQLKMRFGSDSGWTIVEWDPLDLASETLLERFHVFSGETAL
jgi:hypothetical protein